MMTSQGDTGHVDDSFRNYPSPSGYYVRVFEDCVNLARKAPPQDKVRYLWYARNSLKHSQKRFSLNEEQAEKLHRKYIRLEELLSNEDGTEKLVESVQRDRKRVEEYLQARSSSGFLGYLKFWKKRVIL